MGTSKTKHLLAKPNLNWFLFFLPINWAGFPLVTCGNGCDNQDCDAHNTIPPSCNLLTLIQTEMLLKLLNMSLCMFMHCTISLVPMTKNKKPATELTKLRAAMNATSPSLCCCGTDLQT